MRESTLDRKVAKFVKSRGGYALKIHGSMFQAKAIDFVVCYRGYFVAIEDKVGSNKPTDLQLYTLSQIRKAGGKTLVCYDVKQVEALFDEIDARKGRARKSSRKSKEAQKTPRTVGKSVARRISGN